MTTAIWAAAVVVAVLVAVCACAVPAVKYGRKGRRGEKAAEKAIRHACKGRYYLVNGIIIADKKGMTHEIDHIVINANGVFVIETKNYSGLVYGTEEQNEWLQVLGYGNVKNHLRNPVKQNNSHLYCLRQILPDVELRPLVVFVQDNTKNIRAETVIPLSALPAELNRNAGYTLSARQMKAIHSRIRAAGERISGRQHVKNIRKVQAAVKAGRCPLCGGRLVVRHRKDGSGSFYGCSSYPKCKFTRNIEQEQKQSKTE